MVYARCSGDPMTPDAISFALFELHRRLREAGVRLAYPRQEVEMSARPDDRRARGDGLGAPAVEAGPGDRAGG